MVYDISNMAYSESILKLLGFGFIVGLGILALFILATILIALYVYTSLAWMKIAQRMKYKNSWLAWIPIANGAMILQLGGFHWTWIFLILIPILGWIPLFVLIIISHWKIFEKQKYPGWFSLSIIIPKLGTILYLIIIGFVAWKPRKKLIKF